MGVNEVTKGGKDYVGYDYKAVAADSDNASMLIDAYKNFGWLVDDAAPAKSNTLKLKRDRKILNKAELTRLQQHFEACLDEIASLESSKTKMANIYSLVVGLIGTALLTGSVFAVTAEPPMIPLCVLLGIPGLAGWGLAHPVYKNIVKKRTVEVAQLIELKYDEIHEICAKGSALIH